MPHSDTLPDSPIADLAVTLLTPMFFIAAQGDVGLAGRAARAMLEAYGARTEAEILSVTQIIAFALACLSTLTLSMAEDAPPNIALRACNCADRLSKAETRHRKLHEKQQEEAAKAPPPSAETPRQPVTPRPRPTDDAPPSLPPEMLAVLHGQTPPQTGVDANEPVPSDVQAKWRRAFGESAARVADGYEATLDSLPPREREAELFRIKALRRASQLLLSSQPVPEYPDMLFGSEETALIRLRPKCD